jgi:hypothetical protein
MLIDVAIPGDTDRNVIKKQGEKILNINTSSWKFSTCGM